MKKESPHFGIDGYNPPRIKYLKDYPILAKFSPSKRVTLHNPSTIAPAPGHYKTEIEWIKKSQKYKFSKLPRITFSETVIKQSPRTPGPGTYNPSQILK